MNDSSIINKISTILNQLPTPIADWYLGLILYQNYQLLTPYNASDITIMN